MKAKSLDKKFDENKSDIVDELDLSTIKRLKTVEQKNRSSRRGKHQDLPYPALTMTNGRNQNNRRLETRYQMKKIR